MEENDRIGADERRRIEQLEQVKGDARDEVHREIKERTDRVEPQDREQVEDVARGIKHRAVREVAMSEAELARARTGARISQVVDYLFFLLYAVIGLQIALELLGAREGSGFKQFMNAITAPFLAPFKGLMPDPAVGSSQLMLSYIIGLVVYFLVHMAINGALRLLVSKKTVV
jgi:uncharacterized protein YggT (Ycf19 family)